MKRKLIKISIALILIGLLINVTVFAEPLNKTLNFKYKQEEDINIEIFKNPTIISVSHVDKIIKREVFIISQDRLEQLFSTYREMLRGRSYYPIARYNAIILEDLIKKNEEKQAAQYEYLNHVVTIINKWDGKDRIISLDLDEDSDTFIFLI